MPEPMEHAEKRGYIESVLMFIPGFRGYLRKENRREADELQRNWLADRLDRGKRGLDDFSRDLAEAGQIDELGHVDRLRSKLDKVIARIRGAMQGYSGFFDLVDINEKTVDRIYQFDVSLMEKVAAVADRMEALRTAAKESIVTELSQIRSQVDLIDEAWDQREDLLNGIE